MKEIITGMVTGKSPITSFKTPLIMSAVTTVDSVVLAASSAITKFPMFFSFLETDSGLPSITTKKIV
jgi:hypothetical protein